MADGRLMQAMLFDFYGELLTEKQREYYDLHYNEDLSLAEIAEQTGISRQGVWDMIRRADAMMNDIEKKTGLVKRFNECAAVLSELEDMLAELESVTQGRANELARQIRKKLPELRM